MESLILHSIDGPYLFKEKNKAKVIQVVKSANQYHILEEVVDLRDDITLNCTVDNEDRDAFTIPILKKIKSPKSIHKQPEKLLAISDIEGNFNSFYSLLVANGVMDTAFNWTYGQGHLVLNGDFMDRGDNVTQVLWLIYKLEQAAQKAGGMVHFILGNHEVLNLEGKTNYVDKKYIKLAQKYAKKEDKKAAYTQLMADNQELVKWMKSKNAMEKIGNTLFVHGGISPELIKAGFQINQINDIIRNRLNNGPSSNSLDRQDEDFLFASHGPLWYRGLATPYRNFYKKCTEKEVNKALKHFRVKHISIGHTIANKVSLDYNGAIIRTDVSHGDQKNSPTSQALLILDKQLFRVDGKGTKVAL
ncbi:MAG: metallophosphoesterase [Saprospiraceae bacterium]